MEVFFAIKWRDIYDADDDGDEIWWLVQQNLSSSILTAPLYPLLRKLFTPYKYLSQVIPSNKRSQNCWQRQLMGTKSLNSANGNFRSTIDRL